MPRNKHPRSSGSHFQHKNDNHSSTHPQAFGKKNKNRKRVKKTISDYIKDEEAIVEVKESLASTVQGSPINPSKSLLEPNAYRLVEKTFDAGDQEKLSENVYQRFFSSSQKVGHAFIHKNENGELVATQFKAPGTLEPNAPQIIPLKDIELVTQYGALRGRATAADGTKMISKRFVDMETNVGTDYAEKGQLMYFSPETSHHWKGSVFWGGSESKQPPLFRDDLKDHDKVDLEHNLKDIEPQIRGGKTKIDPHAITVRDKQKRKPNQNKVMGRSAINAYHEFFDDHQDKLSSEMKAIFKNAENARPYYQGGSFRSQARPEWLHAVGYGLTPLEVNPQVSTNLAAAPKWLNTKMMVTERALKWHALHRPQGEFEVEANFEMLLDSDLMKKGMIEGTFKEGDKTLKIHQDLNPFVKYPTFNKPTDIAQTTLVTHHWLTDVEPLSETSVNLAPGTTLHNTVYANHQPTLRSVRLQVSPPGTQNKVENDVMATLHSLKATPTKKLSSIKLSKTPKVSGPTEQELNYEYSVVQITSSFYDRDYDTPWKNSEPMACTGSGFVIERNGKRYILTNAHVVENSAHLQVRLADDDDTYIAKPLQVSYQADVALLEVTDPEFVQKTKPLQLGAMVQTKDRVKVVGFPMGGEEVSTTEGIISRIEVEVYAESGESGLQAQTDSAINPGNSGGPVFAGDKVVGIAFQGIGGADGLGYLIPMPVVKHFLEDYFSPGAYKGFPTLGFSYQPLSNAELKKALGLSPKQVGVRITQVDKLSDAKGKLKKGDILVAIDGIAISNDGKCNIDGIGKRINFDYLFQRHQMGELVKLSFLRLDEDMSQYSAYDVEAKLKFRPGETKLVSAPEHEKNPTYFIHSGIVFQPLTMNYLETARGKALREMVMPKHGYLSEVPKKSVDEEMVIISRIFDSEFTKGYEFYENNPVKKVNGQVIKNIHQAFEAFENNTKPFHQIEISSGELLVVKNLSLSEHKDLLRRYGRVKDCSDDLKILRQSQQSNKRSSAPRNDIRIVRPSEDKQALALKLIELLEGGAPESTLIHTLSERECSSDELLSQESESLDLDDYEEDGFVVPDEPIQLSQEQRSMIFSDLTGGSSQGLRRYVNTLNSIANRYLGVSMDEGEGVSFEADDDSDDDFQLNELSSSDFSVSSNSESSDELAPLTALPSSAQRYSTRM